MTTLYKVLVDGKSCHGGSLEWSLPTQNADGTWTPGAWHEVDGEIVVCENGLHLTTQPYEKWMEWGATVYEAEGAGDSSSDGDEDDKTAFQRARLLRPAPVPEWWAAAQEFVKSIKDVKFFQPDGDPDPAWRLFTAPTRDAARAAAWDAAWAAAWAAEWAAARDAAWDAAWSAARDAAWDAAGAAAWDAARDAARAAAWDAARDAAWAAAWAAAGDAAWAAAGDAARDAAWDAARDAAWDARLNVMMAITSDLDVPQQHRDHAAARWRVWQKGYGLLGDVDGVLYVYAEVGA